MLLGGSYQLDDKSSINFNAWAGGGTFGTINVASGSYTLNNISATNQFVSQIETAPNSDQGGSLFYQAEFGPIKDIKIGVDAHRIVISDYNNLFASATSATDVLHRQRRASPGGRVRPGNLPLHGCPPRRHGRPARGFLPGAQCQRAHGQLRAPTCRWPIPAPAASTRASACKFQMTDDLVLRAAVYRNFSAPGMNQMYRSFASGTSYTAINPNLQPMTNIGEEAGFDFKWREFNLSATIFNNNLDNFIDFVTVCNTNAGLRRAVHHRGGPQPLLHDRAAIQQRRQRRLPGHRDHRRMAGAEGPAAEWPGFTTTRAYLTSSNYPALELTGVQLGQVPSWTVTAGAEWRPLPELAFTATLRSFPAYWNDTGHTQFNSAATLIDLGVSLVAAKAVDIYGSIQNLTNANYLAIGLYLDVVRRSDGEHDVHSGLGHAA